MELVKTTFSKSTYNVNDAINSCRKSRHIRSRYMYSDISIINLKSNQAGNETQTIHSPHKQNTLIPN